MDEEHTEADRLFPGVGTSAGEAIIDGKKVQLVGLIFPTDVEGVDDEKFITIPSAKALILDLQDMIDECMKHTGKDQ